MSQVGIKEATGHNDGREVQMYLRSVGLKGNYSWCAAFCVWTYKQSCIENSGSAWSPSCFPQNRLIEKDSALSGDLFGIYFSEKGRIAHVGIVEKWGSWVTTIEGNTDSDGSREGDGVYRKRRLRKQIYQVSRWIQ